MPRLLPPISAPVIYYANLIPSGPEIMGIDAGFDLVPRLSNSTEEKKLWKFFIDCVTEEYEGDELFEVKANYVAFDVGEYPTLPLDGTKFLRFSSKISGKNGVQTEEYVRKVTGIALMILGSRVEPWSEMNDNYGFYGWSEVHKSQRSYDQSGGSILETIPSLARSASKSNNSSEGLPTSSYAIRPIQNKGKGVIARVSIAKGTRILVEKPLFAASSPVGSLDNVILTKVKTLSKEKQRQYLSLHNNYPGQNPFSGIFRTNALPCGSGSSVGAVYPTICFVNHTCIPNSHNNWNDKSGTETIHAIRDIEAGEEITISYTEGEPSRQRLAKLKSSFGFECTCELCSRSTPELHQSDARRTKIKQLDEAIGDPNRTMVAPHRSIADCREMLRLIQQEYDGSSAPLEARLYYDAFQVSIIHSDQARASTFARRAYDARCICEGDDSPEALRMKSLAGTPTQHQSFGVSKRWRTTKTGVPNGLDDKTFEEWLWKRGEP